MSGRRDKKPVTKKVAKVPVILQLEALECGAACLAMVMAYYNKWVPLEQVRRDCGVSRDGSNARNILKAARNYGLQADGYRYEIDALREEGSFPCIIFWEFNHFVVLNGFKKNKAVINDPARGVVEISMEDFDKAFTGVCLMIEPAEGFEPGGRKKSISSFVKKRLNRTGAVMAFTVTVSLIAVIIGIITPLFSKVFLDRLLPGRNPEWIPVFLALLAGMAVIQVILLSLQAIYNVKMEGRLAIRADAQFMWHVLRMPAEFFSQRQIGDISVRKQTNQTIANTLINTLAPTVLDIMMMVIYLFVILRYSVALTVVGVAGLIINISVVQIISSKRVNISRVLMRDQSKLASTTVSGIEMMETIKSSGAENGFFEKWSGYQASVNTQNVKDIRLNQYYGMIPMLVNVLVNTIVLGLGLYLIIRKQYSVGMLYAFQSMLAACTMPVMNLSDAAGIIREMRVDMERVEDVLEYPADVEYSENEGEKDSYAKLGGKVELKNVTFGYSRLAAPLIENFSMTLERGKRVAFVGPSGCGKSTLSKLISGLYKPWSGEILFDGKPLSEIDHNVFTGSLAVVDQDITLFEDTIANNIKMWDDSIEDFEMILASRDASLHEDIMQREGGYRYRLLEGGKDLSGGQRQRLEIARVLSQDPTIIIMDEATSALDAQTEYEVVNSIKDRGITCIVVAHRLSTIRDCDEIIVLNGGKVVERGTHESLMALHGAYEELITSE